MRFLYLLFLLGFLCKSACSEILDFTFTVYAQGALRDVYYEPVTKEAIAVGAIGRPAITLNSHRLKKTGPYSYQSLDRTITFFNESSRQPTGRVTLPIDSDRWLLIFIKNPSYSAEQTGTLPYLIYPFDDSLQNLARNHLIFLNLSGKELDGFIEGKRTHISRGESEALRTQESIPINLFARNFDGSRLLPALNKTYNFDPDHRYLFIFFPPSRKGSADLDVRLLAEIME